MKFTNEELQELVYKGNLINRELSQDFIIKNLAAELFDIRLYYSAKPQARYKFISGEYDESGGTIPSIESEEVEG